MTVMSLLVQACGGTPDPYHVSRQRWVMNLDWYKQVRREVAIPDDEPDEDKWVPGPDDSIFGYPIEVREDGGEPHLVSDHQDVP